MSPISIVSVISVFTELRRSTVPRLLHHPVQSTMHRSVIYKMERINVFSTDTGGKFPDFSLKVPFVLSFDLLLPSGQILDLTGVDFIKERVTKLLRNVYFASYNKDFNA